MATKQSAYANTWDGVVAAATATGAKYPELVAAQWALESAWGKSTSGKNNYFGIKGNGTSMLTQEVIDGKTVTVRADFIDFPDLVSCVSYLVLRWYKNYRDYKGVNNAPNRDAAARSLVEQGYATDPDYAEKLIALMNDQAPVTAVQDDKSTEDALGGTPTIEAKALVPTWLKKKPLQAHDLGEKEKVAVSPGGIYGVLKSTEVAATAHRQVVLDHDAGTWFVFEPHWEFTLEHPVGESFGPDGTSSSGVNWRDFTAMVTRDLSVGEVLQWDPRRIPPESGAVRGRLLQTAQQFQKVRDAWRKPLAVTSFYRPEPINTEVGGVPGSRHTTGEAMDIYPTTDSLESFHQWIRRRWTGGLGDGRDRGFVHLDTRNGGGFVPGAGVSPSVEWLY